jgi:ESF2/ABP1 family protein
VCTAGKNFTEGWVEFEDKAVAKSVAAMLNNQPIGGKHRSAYHFDLWCLKYLPKFKVTTSCDSVAGMGWGRLVRRELFPPGVGTGY